MGESRDQKKTPEPPSDLWLSPDAAIAALAKEGNPIPTGFAPLDRQFRKGGIPPGRVVVIGGPPFAGKTTLVADIALHMSQSAPVFALFSDEGRSQAAVRIGVMLGVALQQIDDDPESSAIRVGELMGQRAIHLLKPDTEKSYAENVVEFAVTQVEPGAPAIILLDSVQTILTRKLPDDTAPESPRIAAKTLVTACRAWAEKHTFTFILTSQANRAFYRSKRDEENSAAIAAFSESGAIEYMADVAIVLSLPDEKSEIVKVRFVKNRLKGSAKSFQVRYSSDTGRLVEIDDVTAEDAIAEEGRQRLSPVKDRILKELRRHKDGLTRLMIQDTLAQRKADVLSALRTLVDEKKVYPDQRGRQLFYVLDRSREAES